MNEIQVLRPAFRFRIQVPVIGESGLLVSRPSAGMEPLPADFADGFIIRSWDWPKERGTESFDRSVAAFSARSLSAPSGWPHDINEFNKFIAGVAVAHAEVTKAGREVYTTDAVRPAQCVSGSSRQRSTRFIRRTSERPRSHDGGAGGGRLLMHESPLVAL